MCIIVYNIYILNVYRTLNVHYVCVQNIVLDRRRLMYHPIRLNIIYFMAIFISLCGVCVQRGYYTRIVYNIMVYIESVSFRTVKFEISVFFFNRTRHITVTAEDH